MKPSKQPWQAPAIQELAIRLTAAHAKGRFIDTLIGGHWSLRESAPPAPEWRPSEPRPRDRRAVRNDEPCEHPRAGASRGWQAPAVHERSIGGA